MITCQFRDQIIKLLFQSKGGFLACDLPYLHANSPLLYHLLTSWCPALQQSLLIHMLVHKQASNPGSSVHSHHLRLSEGLMTNLFMMNFKKISTKSSCHTLFTKQYCIRVFLRGASKYFQKNWKGKWKGLILNTTFNSDLPRDIYYLWDKRHHAIF